MAEKSYSEHFKNSDNMAAQEHYRSFIDNFHGIAFQGDHNFIPFFFHGAVEQITGYTEAEFLAGNPRIDQIMHPDDLAHLIANGEIEKNHNNPDYSSEIEYRIIKKNGEIRWVKQFLKNLLDDSGKPTGVQGTLYDITERVIVEQKLIESEKKFHTFMDSATDLMYITDKNRNFTYVNNAMINSLEYSYAEMMKMNITDILIKGVNDKEFKQITEEVKQKGALKVDDTWITKSGKRIYGETNITAIYDAGGKHTGDSGVFHDITDHKLTEDALLKSEEHFRNLMDQSPLSIQILDIHGFTINVNKAWESLWGISFKEFSKLKYNILKDEQLKGLGLLPYLEKVYSGEVINTPVEEYNAGETSETGNKRWVQSKLYPIKDQYGKVINVVIMHEDITEKKKAEEKKKEQNSINKLRSEIWKLASDKSLSEEEFIKQLLITTGTNLDGLTRVTYTMIDNKKTECLYEWKKEESMNSIIGTRIPRKYFDKILETRSKEFNMETGLEMIPKILRGSAKAIITPIMKKNNVKSIYCVPFKIKNEFYGVLSLLHDKEKKIWSEEKKQIIPDLAHILEQAITEIKAEQALRKSENLYRSLIETSTDGIVLTDLEGKYLFCNKKQADLLGFNNPEELIGKNGFNYIAKEYHEIGQKAFQLLFKEKQIENIALEVISRDGNRISTELSGGVIEDKDGNPINIMCLMKDVTKQKLLEEQMIQTQKMESVGHLAAGIAHDFNNILAAILGFGEIAKIDLENGVHDGEALIQSIDHILKSGTRGKELVQQLLGFSRQGKYNPKNIDLNFIVKDVIPILRKGLPSYGIEYHFTYDVKAKNNIYADTVQIHQILNNLGVNAKDAMGSGGEVCIKTEDITILDDITGRINIIPKGIYVKLSVSDEGSGIDDKDIKNIFNPFFTTKEKGKGTGLGLAMVYGIVKNHNGHIEIKTRLKEGTTFEIYFPAVKKVKTKITGTGKIELKGQGRILIIDNEKQIRIMTEKYLTENGYEVITAGNGKEGLEIYQNGKFDFILTDLIMKPVDGFTVYNVIREKDPGIQIYLMSGHEKDDKIRKILRDEATGFIGKPFSLSELSHIIHTSLYGK